MSKIFYIDLFSGAGGTTTGIHMAGENVKVLACVNHDTNAIESHKANHPECIHFVEDVRDWNVVVALSKLVTKTRREHPGCKIILWASLECTNYSKAKGGLPRDADSRTLAHALFMYAEELEPDGIDIENVREFMSWGPLDENGRPLSKLNGRDYIRWIKKMKSYGYDYDWKLLNAADFGAYTSRERYFGQFAKKGMPLVWPEPTHCKKPVNGGLFPNLKKWKPVREVLDLEDEGESIFTRTKPLSENTLKRIYAGLVKFVANGEDMFIKKYFSGRPWGKVISVEGPAGTVTTMDHQAIVKPCFLSHYYGNGFSTSIEQPCPTLRTKDSVIKVKSVLFMDQQFGQSKPTGIEQPAGTITANPKLNLVSAKPWLMNTNFNNVGSSLNKPAPVITASRKHHYLMNPQYNNKGGSVHQPCFTLIARMDKKPPHIVSAERANIFAIPFFDHENETMKKIRLFMAVHGIIDIKMRMLKIPELLKIQGFPENYKLKGTKTQQKKYIGNAVVPLVAKAIVQTKAVVLQEILKEAI